MKISVITVNLNNAIGLSHTMASVFDQTSSNYEFIIIDGGSTDQSVNVIKNSEQKIAYWSSERDTGVYNAMNKGVEVATGDYCIFMNSGDCFYNEFVLEKIISKNYKADIITGRCFYDGTVDHEERDTNDLSFLLFFRDTISHQSSFIKTELLKKMPYNENYKLVSDWEFFLKEIVLNNCSYVYDDTIVSKYEGGGLSTLNSKLYKNERETVLNRLIPALILKDYKKIKYIDNEILDNVSRICKKYRRKKILKIIIKLILAFPK